MSGLKSPPGQSRFQIVVHEPIVSTIASSGGSVTLLFLALTVIALRLPTIDFSFLNSDEAVYTILGSGLKSGLMPYVDMVDRKPIGIFLIYGFAESLFHNGILGPRILAALATLLSATLLTAFCRRFLKAGPGAALAAGVFFSSYGILFGGDAAQPPVFYMPLVIAAAFIVIRNLQLLAASRVPSATALGIAGLLLGIALQIKYSMIFECAAFGGISIFCGWTRWQRLSPEARRALLIGCLLMTAGGLLPTVIAGGIYAAFGHLDAWYFYNFTVNLGREGSDYSSRAILERTAQFTLSILPLAVLGGAYAYDRWSGWRTPRQWSGRDWVHAAILAWMVSAFLGGLALRQPYAHYFYGVIAPLSLYAGAALQRIGTNRLSTGGGVIATGLVAFACVGYGLGWRHEIAKNGSPELAYKIAGLVRSGDPQSLYVFNSFGILYYLTNQPVPTKYPMPNHLWRDLEARSFQFDAKAELSRVLDQNPEMIVVSRPFSVLVAPDRAALLEARLAQGYCTWRTYGAGRHRVIVYRFEPEIAPHSADRACDE